MLRWAGRLQNAFWESIIVKMGQIINKQTKIGLKNLTGYASVLASTLITMGLWVGGEHYANAAQSFTCRGRMNNGWAYTAQFANGRFTQIRWERSGQPPQTTELRFVNTNAKGQPVYRGAFQAATTVTLVDLSKGNVRRGSEISVGVEEWGWARGRCGR